MELVGVDVFNENLCKFPVKRVEKHY